MRRIAVLALAVASAACHDQPTAPGVEAPDAPAPASAKGRAKGAAPITLFPSQARSLGHTEGDLHRYPNRPEPDLGGDQVVWRWMASPYYGPVEVRQTSVSTGATTLLAELQTYAGPRTSGRYTTWQDGESGIMVHDNATGRRTRIAGSWPLAQSVDAAGDRLAFIDQGAETVEVLDLANGERRVIASSAPGTPYSRVRGLGFDGRYVAFIAEGRGGESGLGMVVHDLATGQDRVAVPFTQRWMTGPSVDAGRVAFSMDAGDRHSVFLYVIATGETRRISDAPRMQQNPEISGDLIVWDDLRDDPNPYYMSNYDVYLYDLRAGVEMPLAAGPQWSSHPQVDGARVVWTERRNDRWEVMLVELAPASLAGLREQLRRAIDAGSIRNPGIARSLEAFLAQAAAAHSAGSRGRVIERLRQFSAHVRQHAGRQIDAATARRLDARAAGVIARM